MNSHFSTLPVFNGRNFSEWREQIKFYLGVMDLDLALREEKPSSITDSSIEEEKFHYKNWEKSNRLSLIYMRMSMASNIKSALPETESVKEMIKFVEERSQTADKSLARTLLST